MSPGVPTEDNVPEGHVSPAAKEAADGAATGDAVDVAEVATADVPVPKAMAAIVGEDFSVAEAIGGWRGAIESTLPALVFVIVYVLRPQLVPALIASVGTAAVLVIARLVQRSTITQAVSGMGGIAIGAIWAALSGKPQDVYAWGLWVNAA
jgi:hypothetical protein